MQFDATPLNMTEVLMLALGVWVMMVLWKRKVNSNLPMIFYLFLISFTSSTDRSVNTYLLVAGIAFALLLRFEFMNGFFTKAAVFMELISLVLIMWTCLGHIFGPNSPFYW